ncbi:MAG: hypothetical protein BMS9Abin29_0999 [Gemmatimonadota bacterium]|nr:MAG: hypothetical protein BMS9Abin29_0999 [Gemmatimonadota bacterium]
MNAYAPTRLAVAVAAALLTIASPAPAQQAGPESVNTDIPPRALGERAPYLLEYDHLTGVVVLTDPKNRVVERWETRLAGATGVIAPVPPNRPVVVAVKNANPLLYTYDVQVVPVAKGSIRACRDIGGEFAHRGVLVALGAYTGQAPLTPDVSGALDGGNVLRLWQQRDQGLTRGAAGAVDEEAMGRALSAIRTPVVRFAETMEAVATLSGGLEDSLRVVAELGDALPVDSLLAKLQASLDRHQHGLSDPARLPSALRKRRSDVANELETLTSLQRAVMTGLYTGLRNDPAAIEVLTLSSRVDQAERSAELGYRELRNDLLRIERARRETRQTFSVAASGDFRRITLKVEPRQGFDDVLRTRDGSVSVFTEPAVGLRCQVGIGFAFMNAPPDYELGSAGVVANREAGETRTAPALTLLLSTPNIPVLALLTGIGIGNDRVPDLYLGGALGFLDPIMLNAGVVWQRERRLPNGISLGAALADPTLLDDLPRSYKPSLFFGVTLVR